MRALSNLLINLSNSWAAMAGLVVFALFMITVLPGQSTGGMQSSPDTSLYYSADQLYRMAETYGPDGRQAYIQARFTFDLIWPLVYTFFLLTALSYLGRLAFPAGSSWRLVNLLPLVGVLFDYLENIATSLVMARYPLATPVVAELAGVFTLLKWLFIGLSFLVLVSWLAIAIWRKFSSR